MKPCIFKKSLATVLFVFLLLFAGRTLQSAPDYLSYFNEFVGGSEQGAKWVADSNLNWGQDNKRLTDFVLEKRIPSVKILSEAMNADIYDYYKIRWNGLVPNDLVNPAPGFYALGIGAYAQQQEDARSWFRGKQPLYKVGKTFYMFEVPQAKTAGRKL